MSFSFQQLPYFLAVAEIGSISGAARELKASQSTLTEAIKSLEADLGITLVQRQARGMALTHCGHTFLRHAQYRRDIAGGWLAPTRGQWGGHRGHAADAGSRAAGLPPNEPRAG